MADDDGRDDAGEDFLSGKIAWEFLTRQLVRHFEGTEYRWHADDTGYRVAANAIVFYVELRKSERLQPERNLYAVELTKRNTIRLSYLQRHLAGTEPMAEALAE